MKKILHLLMVLVIGCSSGFAQSPQGLNYQAVAYDASGQPNSNKPIGIRLSILDGSATGTIVYEETQSPTTDNTGLFSLVIGNGNVVSGAFNAINWGNGSKWLKTEVDITGGTNYIVMGTSQFVSVPYSLYANKAGFNSGSFAIPDGFKNVTRVIITDSVDYTVPAGKNLYIPTATGGIKIDGTMVSTSVSGSGADSKTMLGASENSVIWSPKNTFVCFLVDKTVEWKTINLAGPAFTVPANKQFVILSSSFFYDDWSNPNPPVGYISLNGVEYGLNKLMLTNAVLDEGDVLSSVNCSDPGFKIAVNGYLADK